jgi:flavin reductase (DIM6/NTAB) family NADH-FMN oxidoreductase RutF
MRNTHISIEPSILYFGTPVVLISTLNADGGANIAPMSSAFWLGWRCVLGLGASGKTTENMLRTGQCVLNLPSVDEVDFVDRLARLTGTDPVPADKAARGYRYEPMKFETAGLTPVPSETVSPPRALESRCRWRRSWPNGTCSATTAPGRGASGPSRSASSGSTCGRTC